HSPPPPLTGRREAGATARPAPGAASPHPPGPADGYAKASQAGGRGLGGFGRGAGGRSSGGQHSSRSSRGGLRDAARSLRRGGASPGGSRSGARENGYAPRRAARGRVGGVGQDSSDEPPTASGPRPAPLATPLPHIPDHL